GLLMMAAAYAARMLVLRQVGLEAAGLHHAAWTLGGLYIGFILQAMGADFYPRLVAAVKDAAEANRLVNEQAQVSLLLAGPGVIATLTFAPLVLALFYSAEFAGAVDVLRWICLGIALRVISWPMGFIIIAKSRQIVFFVSELAWTLVNVGLTWICLQAWGLAGAGIAFFASYVFHALMIYPIVRRMSGFRGSRQNRKGGLCCLASVPIVFGGLHVLPPLLATVLGVSLMLLSATRSILILRSLVSAGAMAPWRVRNASLRSRWGL